MENLTDEEKRAFYGLYGIPCAEERELAIPIAKRMIEKHESGLLQLSEKQYNWIITGLKPTPRASSR